jgi:hypothetical protein
MNATKTISGECPKCLGSGRVPFRHIENGVCFQCRGTGKVFGRIKTTTTAAPVEKKLTKEEALDQVKFLVERLKGTNGWQTLGAICERHSESHGTDNLRDEVIAPVLADILRAIAAAA